MAELTIGSPPAKHWFMGHLTEFNADTLNFVENSRPYGDFVKLKLGPFKGYIVHNPDYIKALLVDNAKHVYKSRGVKLAMEDISPENIFVSDGDFWKKQRKLMQPSFHSKRIGAYADVMVNLAQREVASWQDNVEIEFEEAMTRLTMNVITKTMFDAEVGTEANEIGESFTRLFQIVDKRVGRIIGLPKWVPTPENLEVKHHSAKIRDLLKRIIDERRKTKEDKGDLLSMLLLAQDEDGNGMTDEEVINESFIIFGAGHETTANTLTFAHYALSKNPDVREKLLAEVDSVLGGRPATLENLRHLTYTEQVIKETLRLYPPAWIFTRTVVEPITIDGHEFTPYTIMIISPWSLGRDERLYDDPLTFNPERFSSENEAAIHKYAFIPFGGGPRVCIGNQFAMMEATLILATIAQQYQLDLKPNFVTEPKRAFTLRPDNGMKMIAHQRQLEMA